MAKKSRRERKRERQRQTQSKAPTTRTSAAKAKPAASVQIKQAPGKPTAAPIPGENFGEEYSYVIADLKRIGVLAAAMMGLLVALSFIIR